jgi:hypothetical protein
VGRTDAVKGATMSDFDSTRRDDQQSHALGRTEPENSPSIDVPTAEWFCRTVHERAQAVAEFAGLKGCQLVLSSYGELPEGGDAVSWKRIPPKIQGFALGDCSAMAAQAMAWAKEPGRNVYSSMAIYPNGVRGNKRGRASEALGVFGLGVDLDRDKGCKVRIEDLPLPPTIVIRSSRDPADNFNLLWLFKSPITVEEARPLARALADVIGDTDGGTADPIHVWRVPGTLNWPKKTKVARGRPLVPQLVRVNRGEAAP